MTKKEIKSLNVDRATYDLLSTIAKLPPWEDLLPPGSEFGRIGGQSRSAAKQAAARENAKKGGRPKKYEISETPNGYVYKILATGEISNPFKTYGGARLAAVEVCRNKVK